VLNNVYKKRKKYLIPESDPQHRKKRVFRRRMSVRGSKIFIPDPDLDFLLIPDLGFRGQKVPDRGSGSAT
jgi:hypothetical protein